MSPRNPLSKQSEPRQQFQYITKMCELTLGAQNAQPGISRTTPRIPRTKINFTILLNIDRNNRQHKIEKGLESFVDRFNFITLAVYYEGC